MKQGVKNLKHKVPMALNGIKRVLLIPRYAVLALALAFLFAVFIYFFIQIGFYGPLLVSQLPVLDKVYMLAMVAQSMLHSIASSIDGALLALVALLQGVAFAAMVYVQRRNKRFNAQVAGTGGIAMVAAALGLGCVPCGTSLIMPIVTLAFSSSAYAAATTASVIVLVVAFVLSLYSLYKLGNVAYVHAAIDETKEGVSDNEPAW